VEIVGWGVHESTPFWWIKNSWGPEYGDNGYFRFLRGKDHCGLESNVISMLPNLFFPLNRIPYIETLEASLQRLDIFQVNYTPWFEEFQTKVMKSYEPIAPFDYPQVSARSLPQFPLLQYHALSRIGYLNTNRLTVSGYNNSIYRTMPGLYTGVPLTLFPYTRDFYAGVVASSSSTPGKRNKTVPGPAVWLWFFLLLVTLVVLILVRALWRA
jgi:hypothetical protein